MTDRKPARLAWALCLLLIVLAGLGLRVSFANPASRESLLAVTNTVLNAAYIVVFGVIGTLIVGRQPRHIIGWLMTAIGMSIATVGPLATYLELRLPASPQPTFGTLALAWLNGWSWWLLIGPLLLILLLFPTGRLPSRRWRWVVVALAVCFGSFLLLATFAQSFSLPDRPEELPNPLGLIPDDWLSVIFVPWQVLLLSVAVLCVASILVRYRRAADVERAQIKWFLLACALFLAVYVAAAFRQSDAPSYFDLLFNVAILGIPLSIGVAILRYRLYDIDVIIRRTLIYAVLTGLLALAYFGSVVVLENIFRTVTGQGQNQLVTVVSTLAIAALFVPLRRRVQGLIDRRFYRRRYDAARTLTAFGAHLRDDAQADLGLLSEHLTAVAQDTMQPAHVSLWLKPPPAAVRSTGERLA